MLTETGRSGRTRGRPPSTSKAEVARVALELFAERGFDETSVDDIASALGIGRRTLFHYFRSKNDLVWGDFDWVLGRLRAELAAVPGDMPMMEAIGDAVVASNYYDSDQLPELRIRMTLITTVPTLQAHSMIRYAAWRRVIAAFVADIRGEQVDALIPLTISYAALGTSIAAFVRWVDHPTDALQENLRRGYELLATGFDLHEDDVPRRVPRRIT